MEDTNVKNVAETTEIPTLESSPSQKFQISKVPAIPVIIGIIVVLVILVGVIFLARPNPKVVKLVENGNSALKKSDYNKAQEEFKKALEIDKSNAAAETGLINSISLEGNQSGTEIEQLKQSEPIIEESLNAHPNDAELILAAGYAYEAAGEYEKALGYYKKATELAPDSSDAWFNLGHVNQFLANGAEAQKYYDKAYELDPKNPSVNMTRGNTFFSQQKIDESFNSFKTAANQPQITNSMKSEALTGAAIVLMNKDNFKYIAQADAIAKQAVDADPEFSPALGAHGTTQFFLGQTESATSLFNRAITANPRIAKNYYMLGLITRTDQDYKSAIAYLNSAIAAVDRDNTIYTPESRSATKGLYYYELARTYNTAGAPAENILQSLTQAIKFNSNLKARAKVEAESSDTFSIVVNDPSFQTLIN